MQPKISVLIPAYNVEKYIERCLESLFKNSIISECEVILINDCSTDNSFELAKKFFEANKDTVGSYSLIENEKNEGSAYTRQKALNLASGKYIIFVDSDDWVEPDYLEKLYNEAEKINADIVGCDLYSEYPNKTLLKVQPLDSDNIRCIEDMLAVKTNGWLWLKMIRRQLVEENDITFVENINLCEDLIFSVKCFYAAKVVGYVNEPLYHYAHNAGSYMNTKTTMTKAEELVQAIEKIEVFLKEKKLNLLLETLNLQKNNIKFKIVIKGDKQVQKKYMGLWPESKKDLELMNYRKIYNYILKNKCFSYFFAVLLSFIKNTWFCRK